MRKYNILSDLVMVRSIQPVVYKQYDNGDNLEVELYEDGDKISLSTETVLAFFELPDGTVVQKTCSIQNGNAIATLDNNILSQSGNLKVEFTVYKNGNETTTRAIFITVEESINRNEAITTTPQWDIVQQILDINTDDLRSMNDQVNNLKLEYKTPVANFAAIATTYPIPSVGWTVQTVDDGKFYRYNGSSWQYIQVMNNNILADIQNKLSDANRQSQVLTHGTQILNASQNSPVDFEIQGRTLVNLIGYEGNFEKDSDGDGVADGWYKQGTLLTSLSSTSKYGNKSQTVQPTATLSGNLTKDLQHLETTKYYLFAIDVYLSSYNSGYLSMFISDYGGWTNLISDDGDVTKLNQWQTLYVKFTNRNETRMGIGSYSGEVLTCSWDGARLFEVTAEEYAKIGVEWNDEEVAKRFPYVDAVQHLQNVTVIAEGENLLPPFTEWFLHANAKVISPYELELNATGSYQGSPASVKAIPNITYTLSGTLLPYTYYEVSYWNKNGRIGGFDAVSLPTTFTTPNGTENIIVQAYNSIPGKYTFTNPMLTLGATPKPFAPRNPSYLFASTKLGQIGDKKDILSKSDGVWYKRKLIEKDVVLDVNVPWQLTLEHIGYKMVKSVGFTVNALANSEVVIKHNGSRLKQVIERVNGWDTGDLSQVTNTNDFNISIFDVDSGWGETYTPTSDEIKSYFYGWTAKTVDANGKPTAWKSLGDGTDAPTQNLAYVSTNKAPNFTPYKLSYVLDTPQTLNVNNLVEGDIAVSGPTQVEVTSGVIVREKVVPVLSGSAYYINADGSVYPAGKSELKNKVDRIIQVYRNGLLDESWILATNVAYGKEYVYCTSENYDTTAEYTVTYIVLDRHLFTNNATDVKASYSGSLKDTADMTTEKVSDLTTLVSVNGRILVDVLARLKALEV
jgi:hypothetical protein